MITKIPNPLKAYVEKTGQNVTGLFEFHSVCGNKIDGFIPKFQVNQLGGNTIFRLLECDCRRYYIQCLLWLWFVYR